MSSYEDSDKLGFESDDPQHPTWSPADDDEVIQALCTDIGASTPQGAYRLVFEKAVSILSTRVNRIKAAKRAASVACRLTSRVHAAFVTYSEQTSTPKTGAGAQVGYVSNTCQGLRAYA